MFFLLFIFHIFVFLCVGARGKNAYSYFRLAFSHAKVQGRRRGTVADAKRCDYRSYMDPPVVCCQNDVKASCKARVEKGLSPRRCARCLVDVSPERRVRRDRELEAVLLWI